MQTVYLVCHHLCKKARKHIGIHSSIYFICMDCLCKDMQEMATVAPPRRGTGDRGRIKTFRREYFCALFKSELCECTT